MLRGDMHCVKIEKQLLERGEEKTVDHNRLGGEFVFQIRTE